MKQLFHITWTIRMIDCCLYSSFIFTLRIICTLNMKFLILVCWVKLNTWVIKTILQRHCSTQGECTYVS